MTPYRLLLVAVGIAVAVLGYALVEPLVTDDPYQAQLVIAAGFVVISCGLAWRRWE